jgi:NADPH-dependent curcumin reductase CurA
MTQEQERKIQYLESKLKEEREISHKRWNQVQELKKELKRIIDLYIGAIK